MEVDIKRRICNLPDIPFFAIKSMQAIEVKFESNRDTVDDSTGVMAGYATYKEGTVYVHVKSVKHLLSTLRLQDFTRSYTLRLSDLGGSRGGSGGSVEPPNLRSQTPINILFLMKSYSKWVNNYSIF